MTTSSMRKQLLTYLADADEKKIIGLYSLLEDNIKEKKSVPLTRKQLLFLKNERRKHLNPENESYTWEQVKEKLRKRKSSFSQENLQIL